MDNNMTIVAEKARKAYNIIKNKGEISNGR